jgi:hypothetical protein
VPQPISCVSSEACISLRVRTRVVMLIPDLCDIRPGKQLRVHIVQPQVISEKTKECLEK